jgi:uncharacterized protein YjbI with pentapeptide repeats
MNKLPTVYREGARLMDTEDRYVKITNEFEPNGGLKTTTKESPTKKTKSDWIAWGAQVLSAGTLIISLGALVFGVYSFKLQQSTSAQMQAAQVAASTEQTQDQERQATLDTYLDDMSNLLLVNHLGAPDSTNEVRALAIARTDTALRNLDGNRKGSLIRFLWEAKLINEPHPIIPLSNANLQQAYLAHANLSGANLSGAHMYQANLSQANLSQANLSGADLDNADLLLSNLSGTNLKRAILYRAYVSSSFLNFNLNAAVKDARDIREAHLYPAGLIGADLSGAFLPDVNLSGYNLQGIDLSGADLYGADLVNVTLHDANLRGANLSNADLDNTNLYRVDLNGAQVTTEQLSQAGSLKGAIMPDGSMHI